MNGLSYLHSQDEVIELRSRVEELEKMWQLEHTEKITLEEKLKHIEQMNEWHKEQWIEEPVQPEGDASYWRAKYEDRVETIQRLSDAFLEKNIENARLREMVSEMQTVLNDWNMAWITDCIVPAENGVSYNGIDEGLVRTCEMMKPILEKTRMYLPIPPLSEVNHE